MRVLFSILINAWILFVIAFLLPATETIPEWVTVVWWWKTYVIWGVILWLMNVTIKPILKILSLPLFFLSFWLMWFATNALILWLLSTIFEILWIQTISYEIYGWINYAIAVAIFTILNMVSSLLFSKK